MPHHEEGNKVKLSKPMLSSVMNKIDICMMTTVAANGDLHSRPMSNNSTVDWDGETWFFAQADSSQAQEIERKPHVNLAYAVPDDIVFVSVTGRGEIVRDDQKKEELWYDDLERWFDNGPDDDNVVLIRVKANYVYYWSKEGDGELDL